MDIYICGHGGWDVMGRSSVFVTLPAGTEVVFYKQVGEELLVSEAEAIMRRSGGAPQPVRVIKGYMQCPDMTLHPAKEFWTEFGAAATGGGVQWHAVAQPTRLSYFLQRYPSCRIHWIACSVRSLKPV